MAIAKGEPMLAQDILDLRDGLQNQLNVMTFFPKGTILTFSSEAWNATSTAFKNIWKICDGNNGTQVNDMIIPDLRNKFLRGGTASGEQYNNPTTGNTQMISVPVPRHRHTITDKEHNHWLGVITSVIGNEYTWSSSGGGRGAYTQNIPGARTGITETNYEGDTDSSITVNTMPSYYTVIYIIKVA
jgi:hypothetical protein